MSEWLWPLELLVAAVLASELRAPRWAAAAYGAQGLLLAAWVAPHSVGSAVLVLVGRGLILPWLVLRGTVGARPWYMALGGVAAGALGFVVPFVPPPAAVLLAVGTWIILTHRDRVRQVLGIGVVENGIHLLLPELGLAAEAALLGALVVAVWLLLGSGGPEAVRLPGRAGAPGLPDLSIPALALMAVVPFFIREPLALLAAGLAAAAIAFTRWYLRERDPLIYICIPLFAGAVVWASAATDLIWLLLAVEVSTLASAPLIAGESRYKYLIMNVLGLAAALMGLALRGTQPLLAGALVIVGLGTKAGLVPIHGWLPDAYAGSSPGFTPLFAGVGTKVALVALIRVLPAVPALQTVLVVLGCITMVVGVISAFGQTDLRRLLAYSSVSQAGYIAMGIGVGGLAAAEFHIISHALLKSLLFFCAAALGSHHRRLVAVLFFVGALGLGGVPPLPAFWSKFALFVAAARAGYPWAAAVAVLVSLLTITLLVRAGSRIFLMEGGEQKHAVAAADD